MTTEEAAAGTVAGVDSARAWAAATGALALAVAGGSVLFPDEVYGEFVWQYFWGPVYADANGAVCAVWDGGARRLLSSSSACRNAAGPVAYPGYTLVSEVGYMLVLLLMLSGVVILLRRLDIGRSREFFFALLPFMFLGGALRVVEDAHNAARAAGASAPVGYPLNTLLISPLIYFTMFALTLAVLVAAVWVARSDVTNVANDGVAGYRPLLAAGGTVLLVATLAYLAVLSATTGYVEFHPLVFVVTLVLATAAAAGTWWLATEYVPELEAGTGAIGAVVVWGHAVDGAANVVALDWAAELGLGADLVPKHPVNAAVVDITGSLLPPSVVAVTGDTWPFLVLKLAVATAAVWLFNDDMVEESPRFSILMLVAVLAVGLGPGTRDLLRATFGV